MWSVTPLEIETQVSKKDILTARKPVRRRGTAEEWDGGEVLVSHHSSTQYLNNFEWNIWYIYHSILKYHVKFERAVSKRRTTDSTALWILLLFSLKLHTPPTPCLGLVVPIPTPVCCYDTSPLFVKRHRGTWRPQAHFLTQHLPCEPQHVIRTATHSTNTDHKLLCSSSYSSLYENNKIYFIITKNHEFNVSNFNFSPILPYIYIHTKRG